MSEIDARVENGVIYFSRGEKDIFISTIENTLEVLRADMEALE